MEDHTADRRPEVFAERLSVAGTPAGCAEKIRTQIAPSGVNHVICALTDRRLVPAFTGRDQDGVADADGQLRLVHDQIMPVPAWGEERAGRRPDAHGSTHKPAPRPGRAMCGTGTTRSAPSRTASRDRTPSGGPRVPAPVTTTSSRITEDHKGGLWATSFRNPAQGCRKDPERVADAAVPGVVRLEWTGPRSPPAWVVRRMPPRATDTPAAAVVIEW
ncbi:hypothetical protein ACFXAE_04215 [Streptomyces sp. NPDC059454]|uniref:hypothetical protein n=1 Tax=Streptomyces sp. NPDC059454 TaxID=3346836 RepID=UPI00368E4490